MKYLGETLGIAVIIVTLWFLFDPDGLGERVHAFIRAVETGQVEP